jgi:iron complex transport system substrate-binding protein
VWESVEQVGSALDDVPAGRGLARSLRARTDARRPSSPAIRVAVVEWLDPPILAGLWVPEMVAASGGRAVGVHRGRPGVRTTWPELVAARPDILVLSPCSFSVDRTSRELRDPRLAHAVSELQPSLGAWIADESYFSRPGPRLADGVDLLRHLLGGSAWTPPMPVAPVREVLREASP